MNLLAEILSSNVRAQVFRILWGSSPVECHMRELERRAGFSIGTIQQEVKKLERIGLLIKRVDGNRAYFKANQSHPIYENIRQLVLKTVGLVDILHEALVTEKIQAAFVFGSIAQGTANAQSDIDLFIIGDLGLRDLSKRLKEPSQILGREINPHIMKQQEWLNRLQAKEHFVNAVASGQKIMIIGGENELERMGS